MDSDWSKAAELWLSEFGWSELDRDGFTKVDIDWFSDEPPAKPVPAALACVQAALTTARKRYPQLEPLVTVPLGFSDNLDLAGSELGPVLERHWSTARVARSSACT